MASTKAGHADTANTAEYRALGYLAPWLGLVAAAVVGSVVYLVFGRSAGRDPQTLAVVAVVETLGALALVWVAWDAGRPRGTHMQVFGMVFTGACSLWVIVATIFGPQHRPVWGSLMVGVVFVAAHNIRRAQRGHGDDEAAGGGTLAGKIQEAKRQIKNPRVDPDTGIITARVIANREAETIEDVQKHLPGQIAAIEGLPKNAATITPDPGDYGAGTLKIVPGEPLTGTIVWPGPSAPGESIIVPIVVGTYVDRAPVNLWLPGDGGERNASHMKVMGVNGAGKSEAMKTTVTDALTRTDFVVFASDHVKGVQTFGPLVPYIDWCVINNGADSAGAKARARMMLDATRRLVACNADMLGRAGMKQWCPEAYIELGIPFTMVWLEEAAELVADAKSFTRLTQQARSAGIILVWSGQRASWTALDTDARAQLATEWCFGVGDDQDAKFGLPEVALDAGADPTVWGNRKPGMSYLVAPGIAEDRWAMQLRTKLSTDHHLGEVLAEFAGGRAKLHDQGVRALGEDYARRELFTTTPGTVLVPSQTAVTSYDEDSDDPEGTVDMVAALDPELQVDSKEPIGEPEINMGFGVPEPSRKLSITEARSVVQRHLRDLVEAGAYRTQAADIHKMKPETTRSSEWVRKELIRLCEAAEAGEVALERHDEDDVGVFRIVALVGSTVGADVART